MYRNTRFRDLMKGLPRGSFEKIVDQQGNDKHNKGFTSWDQLIAMIYAQVSGCESLRELKASFNGHKEQHYHLGTREIKRSTLADANRNRSCELFEHVCGRLIGEAHRQVRSELKDLLYLIDSSPIPLKGLGYEEWTKDNHNYRTQGLKVHMIYAPKQELPVQMKMTAPNINDVEVGRETEIEEGATYVFDKGYYDYNWWYEIEQNNAKFVTRFKSNASVESVKNIMSSEPDESEILKDEEVRFKHKRPGKNRINRYHGKSLRRVVVHRPDKKYPLILATNDFDRSAEDIAELYKKRWGIELFFKWLKQNLKIKKFLGRSENAVKIQIYTALITYLLAFNMRRREGNEGTMKHWFSALKSTLFQRTEIESYSAKKRRRREKEFHHLQGNLAI